MTRALLIALVLSQPSTAPQMQPVRITNGTTATQTMGIQNNPLWVSVVDGGTRVAIDSGNSSSTLLLAGATFPGVVTAAGTTAISVIVYSDVASATNGLSIQASTDGTTWYHLHRHTVPAATDYAISLPVMAAYYKVTYTNGGSNQTTFKLQTLQQTTAQTGSVVLVDDIPTSEDHAQLTQSVIVGKTTAGGGTTYVPVKVNPSGALTADVTQGTSPWVVSGTVTTSASTVASANNTGACVSVSTTTTVLASNASRRRASVCARASNTDTIFMKLGATATTSNFPLEPGQCFNMPGDDRVYTGVIDAIANSGTQSACVLELN